MAHDRTTDAQPEPINTSNIDITELVIQDLRQRQAMGITKYGDTLRPFNNRNALIDLYQELIDAVQYLRQYLYETDHPNR